MKTSIARLIKVIAVILVVCAFLYGTALLLAARSLRQAYAELEAAGRPMTLEEVEPSSIPLTKNAGPLYEAALLLLESEPVGNTTLCFHLHSLINPDPNDSRTPEEIESDLHVALQNQTCIEALNLIRKGSTRKFSRFDDSSTTKWSTLSMEPEASSFKLRGIFSLGQLLKAQANCQMETGDMKGAWDTAVTSLQFADSFSKSPEVIGQMLRQALASLGSETIQTLCSVSVPDPEQMEKLLTLLRTQDDSAALARCMDAHRIVWNTILFGDSQEQKDSLVSSQTIRERNIPGYASLNPMLWADFAFYQRYHLQLARDFEQLDSKLNPQSGTFWDQMPFYCLLSRMTIPVSSEGYVRKMGQKFVQLRITAAGLAAIQYQTKHGAFPHSLAELTSLNVQDPFTGRPLSYEIEPDGFSLFSPGPTDDPEDDISWQYHVPSEAASMPEL